MKRGADGAFPPAKRDRLGWAPPPDQRQQHFTTELARLAADRERRVGSALIRPSELRR